MDVAIALLHFDDKAYALMEGQLAKLGLTPVRAASYEEIPPNAALCVLYEAERYGAEFNRIAYERGWSWFAGAVLAYGRPHRAAHCSG
ncbi:hypothetical protein LJK87_09385 [Paenibacillus sp. P25]|nr:hypothetical protein LJK87_09385 [Paenibacillus sp. P25]